MSYDKVRAFIETYRVWPQADTDLERELTEVLELAEQGDAEEEALDQVAFSHVPEPCLTEDSLVSVERLLTHYGQVAERLRAGEGLELWTPEGSDQLGELLAQRDALNVFRSRVLGVVKQAGALDIKAQPDDNHLVILLTALMP